MSISLKLLLRRWETRRKPRLTRLAVELQRGQQGMLRRFCPSVLTRYAEHRNHHAIAKGHKRTRVHSPGAGNIHITVSERVVGGDLSHCRGTGHPQMWNPPGWRMDREWGAGNRSTIVAKTGPVARRNSDRRPSYGVRHPRGSSVPHESRRQIEWLTPTAPDAPLPPREE